MGDVLRLTICDWGSGLTRFEYEFVEDAAGYNLTEFGYGNLKYRHPFSKKVYDDPRLLWVEARQTEFGYDDGRPMDAHYKYVIGLKERRWNRGRGRPRGIEIIEESMFEHLQQRDGRYWLEEARLVILPEALDPRLFEVAGRLEAFYATREKEWWRMGRECGVDDPRFEGMSVFVNEQERGRIDGGKEPPLNSEIAAGVSIPRYLGAAKVVEWKY